MVEKKSEMTSRVSNQLAIALLSGEKTLFQEILGKAVHFHGLSAIATRAKISRSVVSRAINPTKNPRLGTICKILKAIR